MKPNVWRSICARCCCHFSSGTSSIVSPLPVRMTSFIFVPLFSIGCNPWFANAKPPEMRGKGGAGDLPCRGARGTLSGGQCGGAPCLSLFPKEVGWLGTKEVSVGLMAARFDICNSWLKKRRQKTVGLNFLAVPTVEGLSSIVPYSLRSRWRSPGDGHTATLGEHQNGSIA